MDPRKRLRRTRLYVPGNNPAMVFNAGVFGPDSIIFDLEDSVAVNEKDAARLLVRNALLEVDYGRSERTVRINGFDTPFFEDDVRTIVAACPDAIVLPKTESAKQVQELADLIAEIEEKNNIPVGTVKIMPIIESAKGVIHSDEIAFAHERVVGISPGGEDLTADLNAIRTKEGTELMYVRQKLIVSAAAAKIQIWDTVYSNIDDINGLIENTKKIISMGFSGKACIHPKQIEPIHKAFTPTEEEISRAKRIVTQYQVSLNQGVGAIAVDGRMIDVPVYNRALYLLRRAKAAGYPLEGINLEE